MRDAPKRRAARVGMVGLVAATTLAGLWLAIPPSHIPAARSQQPLQLGRPAVIGLLPVIPAAGPERAPTFFPAAHPARAPSLLPLRTPATEPAPSQHVAVLRSPATGRFVETYAPAPPRRPIMLAARVEATTARPRMRPTLLPAQPDAVADAEPAPRPRPRLAGAELAASPASGDTVPARARVEPRPAQMAATILAAEMAAPPQSTQASAPPPRPARRAAELLTVAAVPPETTQPARTSASGGGLLAALFRKENSDTPRGPEPRATRIAAAGTCPADLIGAIPARPRNAPGGNAFVARLGEESGAARDRLVATELLSGNLPDSLRALTPVTLSGRDTEGRLRHVTVCVMPDYLAVGRDDDFVRLPMGLPAAARIADSFGFLLPTTRIVDAVFAQAGLRLSPRPMPPGEQMRTTSYFRQHNTTVERQRNSLSTAQSTLIAGQKKDLVLSNALRRAPGRVAIYGWHRGIGQPIQPLSTVHGALYADYSHGVRLVSRTAFVDGQAVALTDLLADPAYADLLSDEGPILAPERLIASLYR